MGALLIREIELRHDKCNLSKGGSLKKICVAGFILLLSLQSSAARNPLPQVTPADQANALYPTQRWIAAAKSDRAPTKTEAANSSDTIVKKYARFLGNYKLKNGKMFTFGRDGDDLFFMNYRTRQLSWLKEQSPNVFSLKATADDATLTLIEGINPQAAQIKLRFKNGREVLAQRLPLKTEQVSFQNGDVKLAGMLWLPSGKGPHPAIVLVGGSGPVTRYDSRHYPYFFLSLGYAVLTYDKRGAGQSTGGDYQPQAASFRVLADDVIAGVEMLRKRADIRANKVGLLGISNGAWVIVNAAARTHDVAFIISVVGGGVPAYQQEIYRIRTDARRKGLTSAEVDEVTDFMRRLYNPRLYESANRDEVKSEVERLVRDAKNKRWFKLTPAAQFAGVPWEQLSEMGTRIWNNELSYDPASDLQKVRCPVLGLLGEIDQIMPTPETAAALAENLRKAGNHNVTIKILPKTSHWQTEGIDETDPGVNTYAVGLFETLKSWLGSRAR